MVASNKSNLDAVIEIPWKSTFLPLMRKKGVDRLVKEGNYQFSLKHDSFLKSHWELISPHTLVDPFRMGVILDLLDKTLCLEGDIVECGSYKGGTGILMALFLKERKINKKIQLFDSFEGLPAPKTNKDKGYAISDFKSDYSALSKLVNDLELDSIINIHPGWFTDTIPMYSKLSRPISLLHIDCDLYQSTLDSYGILQRNLEPGAAVIFDDYNDGGGGEKEAVKELTKEEILLKIGPAPQAYYFQGQNVTDTDLIVRDQNIVYDFSDVVINEPYLSWLKKVGRIDYQNNINHLIQIQNGR